MKSSFKANLAVYKANLSRPSPINKEISPRSNNTIENVSTQSLNNEIDTLKKVISQDRNKLTEAQNNYHNVMQQLNFAKQEITNLKQENQRLLQINQEQSQQIIVLNQINENNNINNQVLIKNLEKSLIDKDKDLSQKDGVIKGQQDAFKLMYSTIMHTAMDLNQNANDQQLDNNEQNNLQNMIANLSGVNDIQTVQSQVIGDNSHDLTPYDNSNSFSIEHSNNGF